MARGKKALPKLSELIEKFSQEDVIAVMEKEYQSSPTRLIPSSLIDDTSFVSFVKVSEQTIEAFASGLQEKGFYNPLVVREKAGGRYELVLGRKRFLGAKRAGILSLPCVVLNVGDEEVLLMLLADTRDQRDTNVVELATICKALMDLFHYTQKTLADLTHQSRSQITNILRILSLPSEVLDLISLGELSYGHAKALCSLPPSQIGPLLRKIHDEGLSVRDAEALARDSKSLTESKEEKALLSRYNLCSDVSIQAKSVTFRFASTEDKRKFILKMLKKQK
ncbi:MAG: ParB/RepB/Spo0J family partition protein [Firmicutes bacterium]|uniref:ParB/RepB/Spo0J family partition protein n=1 Tax=Candidatus Alloenteromonas pullistercoris TaxID=2840785 RepID=A0A9D9DDK9_9FIRM|nr:ParB/RepB/Spo0J family partition protein [Candidatus Enteromonas pullistercoris]